MGLSDFSSNNLVDHETMTGKLGRAGSAMFEPWGELELRESPNAWSLMVCYRTDRKSLDPAGLRLG
jgi:hypothetical protein